MAIEFANTQTDKYRVMMKLRVVFILATIVLFIINLTLQARNPQEIRIGEKEILDHIQKDETSAVVHFNNGDFFLHYEILTGEYGSNQTMKHWIAHFIPAENNRFLIEDRLHSEGYAPYSWVDNIPLWYDIIYPDDTPMEMRGYVDELPVYAKLLEYYLTHKEEITILKDE